jgi:hypothetical protein
MHKGLKLTFAIGGLMLIAADARPQESIGLDSALDRIETRRRAHDYERQLQARPPVQVVTPAQTVQERKITGGEAFLRATKEPSAPAAKRAIVPQKATRQDVIPTN